MLRSPVERDLIGADMPHFHAESFPHVGRTALVGHDDVDDALETWSMEQSRTGERMVALARQLEQALIWSIPDFSRINETAMRNWWQDAATLPEDIAPSSEKQETAQRRTA